MPVRITVRGRVAIYVPEIEGTVQIAPGADTRRIVEFTVESTSGRPISWTTDLLHEMSGKRIVSLKYTAFFPESEKEMVRSEWRTPEGKSLLRDIESGRLPVFQPELRVLQKWNTRRRRKIAEPRKRKCKRKQNLTSAEKTERR